MTVGTFPTRIVFCGVDLGTAASHDEALTRVNQHLHACISEGICPVHHTRLNVVPIGLCRDCRKVWHATDIEVGWDLYEGEL